jgi:hypothetical protein
MEDKFKDTGEYRKIGGCSARIETDGVNFRAICPGKYNWVSTGAKSKKYFPGPEDAALHKAAKMVQKGYFYSFIRFGWVKDYNSPNVNPDEILS